MESLLSDPNPWLLAICGGTVSSVIAGLILNYIAKNPSTTSLAAFQIFAVLTSLFAGFVVFFIAALIGITSPTGAGITLILTLLVGGIVYFLLDEWYTDKRR